MPNIDVGILLSRVDRGSQSNLILFNGVPIEKILNIKVSENYC
jgi:hypothetical protein